MEIASELLSYGVNAHEMAEMLPGKTYSQSYQIVAKGACDAFVFTRPQNQLDGLVVRRSKSAGGSNEDMEGLVNYPREYRGRGSGHSVSGSG